MHCTIRTNDVSSFVRPTHPMYLCMAFTADSLKVLVSKSDPRIANVLRSQFDFMMNYLSWPHDSFSHAALA